MSPANLGSPRLLSPPSSPSDEGRRLEKRASTLESELNEATATYQQLKESKDPKAGEYYRGTYTARHQAYTTAKAELVAFEKGPQQPTQESVAEKASRVIAPIPSGSSSAKAKGSGPGSTQGKEPAAVPEPSTAKDSEPAKAKSPEPEKAKKPEPAKAKSPEPAVVKEKGKGKAKESEPVPGPSKGKPAAKKPRVSHSKEFVKVRY
jgi:hypothetical protein